jgi:hypothetical protein
MRRAIVASKPHPVQPERRSLCHTRCMSRVLLGTDRRADSTIRFVEVP